MTSDDAVLVLAAAATDAEALDRVEHVVGGHLERFAEEEGLVVTWQRVEQGWSSRAMRSPAPAVDVADVEAVGEGMAGALARVQELQQRLTTLRPPAPSGQFAALLHSASATAAPAGAAAAPAAPGGTSAAWSAALRPSVLTGSGTAARTAAAGTTASPALDAASFPNGRIPEAALASIGGGERLAAPAAEGFLTMRAAAKAAGIDLPVNDSYRSYEEQVDVARRKGLYSEGGLAAKPGTSDHGRGMSVDLQLDGEALAWMRANAERFGFSENVAREPWHWTYGA